MIYHSIFADYHRKKRKARTKTLAKNTKKLLTPLAPNTDAKGYLRSVFKGERKYFGICFLLPLLIMFIIYICMEVFPFGEESVLVLDLNGQYVYFFEELKNIIYGDGSLLYSFSRAMGGEFFGIFAYYLSSPFSFIVALFPDALMTEALLVMFLLKTGCCGLTFAVYIDATRKRNPVPTVIFSTMYALCAYAVVMQHNTMWIDNLILLPIIMLGIENIIKYGRYKMFVISLAMAIFSNFYIGYMTCIFVALYFFYYYFACDPKERNPMGEDNHFVRSFVRIGIFSVIVLMICAALLITTYYSLGFGKTEFSNPNFALDQKFDWMDMISKFYFGSYDTVRPEGLPWLYTGMLTLVLAPLYFFAPHIKTREKIACGTLVVFFFLSFNATTLDLIWHGFQRPNWLNYRYSFILCFILVLMAYKAFERLAEIGYRKVIASSAAVAAIILVIQKLELENVDNLKTVWCSLIITFIYLCVLRASTMPDKELRKTAALVLVILCSLEMFCAGLVNVISLDEDVIFSSRTSYQSFRERLEPVVDKIHEQDTSFYRMEKTVHRKTNDPYMLDMNGFSGSTSTLNEETITLLNRMGLSSKAHWTKYLGSTPLFDSLFGIKYLICEANETQPLYEYMFTYDDDLAAYKNNYALSIAYCVGNGFMEYDIENENYYSPFTRMNEMVTYMIGSESTIQMFKPETVTDISTTDAIASSIANHAKYEPSFEGATASVTYTMTITDTDTLYCYFPSDYTREVDLYLNGERLDTYYANETYRIMELGCFNIGDTVTVRLELKDQNLYIREDQNYFCYMDSETFKKHMPTLQENQFNIEKYTESYFEGTINAVHGKTTVFTTLAYDEGWKVYVDGKEADTFKLIEGTVGFNVKMGEHKVVIKYRPDCLYTGIALNLAGLAIFAAIWILEMNYRKKQIKAGRAVYEIEDINYTVCLPEESAFEEAKEKIEEKSDAEAIVDADDQKDKGDNT